MNNEQINELEYIEEMNRVMDEEIPAMLDILVSFCYVSLSIVPMIYLIMWLMGY